MVAGPYAKSCLCGLRTSTVLFKLRARKLGYSKINIRVETLKENICSTNIAADIIYDSAIHFSVKLKKVLIVEAPGIKMFHTNSIILCDTWDLNDDNRKLVLKLPDHIIPYVLHTKVSVIGDVIGTSLVNFNDLLRMPYGSGEQNMARVASIIHILNYLNNTNQLTPATKWKALDSIRIGKYIRNICVLVFLVGEHFLIVGNLTNIYS